MDGSIVEEEHKDLSFLKMVIPEVIDNLLEELSEDLTIDHISGNMESYHSLVSDGRYDT